MADLQEYALDLQQNVLSRSELGGAEAFQESAFVQIMLEELADASEVDDATVCLHRSLGLQVSAYAVSEDGESLDLIVAVHTNEVPPKSVPKSDMLDAFKRVAKFFEKCTRGYFKSIEEATATFDLAQLIHAEWRKLSRVRFLLVTDGICRNDPPQPKILEGLRATYDIWDAERFYRNWSSGREREEIEIDFEKLIGHAVPCLPLDNEGAGYTTLLAIFPGRLLVELYGQYGPRLLERNVRSFLQVKGSVNKGIRDTIREESNMFLAYNNGLSCTASSVVLDRAEGGATSMKAVRDLQIVNGGQTTASIYHSAMKDKSDVSGIGVQVKLTILRDPERMDEVVPLISKYANSQNKVQTADLMANDKFHRRIEELSRTIWAPARDGTLRQTRWFYERARGQYRDDIARERTPARKKDFETTHPKDQMFTKTDLAKFALTWEMRPSVVSKGAQFAFSAFTVGIDAHVKAEGQVDQAYFERLVAKAILFRDTERIVRDAKYPGYRANIVTYTIAKLVHLAKGRIDIDRIWREQAVYKELEPAISKIAKACYQHIVDGAAGGNVTQYCKKEECWTSFRDDYLSLPDETVQSLSRSLERGSKSRNESMGEGAGQSSSASDPGVNKVIELGSAIWLRVAAYGEENRLLSPKQLETLTSIALTVGEGRRPVPRTAEIGLSLLSIVQERGFES